MRKRNKRFANGDSTHDYYQIDEANRNLKLIINESGGSKHEPVSTNQEVQASKHKPVSTSLQTQTCKHEPVNASFPHRIVKHEEQQPGQHDIHFGIIHSVLSHSFSSKSVIQFQVIHSVPSHSFISALFIQFRVIDSFSSASFIQSK